MLSLHARQPSSTSSAIMLPKLPGSMNPMAATDKRTDLRGAGSLKAAMALSQGLQVTHSLPFFLVLSLSQALSLSGSLSLSLKHTHTFSLKLLARSLSLNVSLIVSRSPSQALRGSLSGALSQAPSPYNNPVSPCFSLFLKHTHRYTHRSPRRSGQAGTHTSNVRTRPCTSLASQMQTALPAPWGSP
jgi:hypothetical protein